MLKKIRNNVRALFFLPYSLIFNFYYLPFAQAIRLPFLFYVRPTFLSLKGNVKLAKHSGVRFGMIKLGKDIAPILNKSMFRWENAGNILFHGSCIMSHHTFISCGHEGTIEFGANSSYSFGLRIIAYDKISFADKARISWDCTFIDTDFHSVIDMTCNKPVPMTSSIQLGYACWVGHNVIISKGVRIPDNCIVASGSVVKSHFKQANTIIGGNLAIVIDDGYRRDDV